MTQGNPIAWLGSLEAIVSRHHSSSRTIFPEHPPQIIHKSFRLFIRRKVASRSMFRLEHNRRFGANEPTQCVVALSLNPRTKHKRKNERTLGGPGQPLSERKIPRRAPSHPASANPWRRLIPPPRSRSSQTLLDPPAKTRRSISTSTLTNQPP